MREHCAGSKESSGAASVANHGASPRVWRTGLLTAFWFVVSGSAPSASAATLSYTGSLTQDDQVVLFPFTVTDTSDATFRTLSYGGGTDADGNPVSSGGFDPVLSLFDGSGDLLIFVDDGSEPDINADPVTGLALDSFFIWSLTPGNYTLALSQSNNYPGLTLSDPFSRQGEGNFTETYGCGAGQFWDFGCDARTGNNLTEVALTAASQPVPLPGSFWLFLSGCCVYLRSGTWQQLTRLRSHLVMLLPLVLFSCSRKLTPLFGMAVLLLLTRTPFAHADMCVRGGSPMEIVDSIGEAKSLPIWGFFHWNAPTLDQVHVGPFTYDDHLAAMSEVLLQTPLHIGFTDVCGPAGVEAADVTKTTYSPLGQPCDAQPDASWLDYRNGVSTPITCDEGRKLYGWFAYCVRIVGLVCKNGNPVPNAPLNGSNAVDYAITSPALPLNPGPPATFGSGVVFFIRDPCPVPPLTPLDELNYTLSNGDPDTIWQEDNPNTPNTARLTPETAQAKQCIDDRVRALGGTPVLASGFRTDAYQRHLWEIYDRRMGQDNKGRLKKNTDPACAVLKAAVNAEWDKHGLGGLEISPAKSAGLHPQGRALDYSRKITIRPLERLGLNIRVDVATQCSGVTYPEPIRDKGHFVR